MATHIKQVATRLQSLKEQGARGQTDLIFLQETHLREEENTTAAQQYAAMWGYKHTAAYKYSLWSSGADRRAGVAILVNPYGAVKEVKEWGTEYWNEHLMMAVGIIGGKSFLFLNIYAPSAGPARIAFFNNLRRIPFPIGISMIWGGDYNCVLDVNIDRIGNCNRDDMGARALEQVIQLNGLEDAGNYTIPQNNYSERRKYADTYHTHKQPAADGMIGSSRIDRWYITAVDRKMLRGIQVVESFCQADHRGVILELHSPRGIVRIRRRPKLYPPPPYAETVTKSLIEYKLRELAASIQSGGEESSVVKWDQFKRELAGEMTQLKKEARRRTTRGFRQRIRRIKIKLGKCGYTQPEHQLHRQQLLDELANVQGERGASRRRCLVASNAWSSKRTTKQFYRRICTKYGDNTIPHLQSTIAGSTLHAQQKADILAESWEPILNGAAEVDQTRDNYINRVQDRWEKVDLVELDEPITAEEVSMSIAKCKRGKACGPDSLSNDWYLDNQEKLIPVLLTIFNSAMEEGVTPKSFVEAFIFSISKGGDASNPLNYRPIALLNSDYKIFTRILAWRLRKRIASIVHSTQFGFIPGRTIHEATDLFEAAKHACQHGEELTEAQVLMLDFAKAYDSLDREFLYAVLKAKGFPEKFCRIVEAIHTNTTVRFLANGELSREVGVTSGIRQGCPLAPLLFIIAVDLLYDEVEMDPCLQGIPLTSSKLVHQLRVAGYADDTAIYIANKAMQRAAINAVGRFSQVSGLMLNVRKSVAIRLGSETDFHYDEDDEAAAVETQQVVTEVDTARYLGHFAGTGNTVSEAWDRAFRAITVRLALAQEKTNTAQQRATIAAAIIVPKLLYVARHAWPPSYVIKQADQRIRNFVWKSSFARPDSTIAGWIKKDLAERSAKQGGLGLPNIEAELVAMSATTVATWAMTDNTLMQITGDLLQQRGGEWKGHISQQVKEPTTEPGDDLWSTGRPWVQWAMPNGVKHENKEDEEGRGIRMQLRAASGVTFRWEAEGLQVNCGDSIKNKINEVRRKRRKERGDFLHSGMEGVELRALKMWDLRGRIMTWQELAILVSRPAHVKLGELVVIDWKDMGQVIFRPVQHKIPMNSKVAELFKELCCNIIANYPETVFKGRRPEELIVHHHLEDQHHSFEVVKGETPELHHTWGSSSKKVPWAVGKETVSQAAARWLEAPDQGLWVTPHPWLTRMRPLWAGKRRWSMTRKQFKVLLARRSVHKAKIAIDKIEDKWRKQHKQIADALCVVQWGRIQKMEGVPAYQVQNVMKLKWGRLRLWCNKETQYNCRAEKCAGDTRQGADHLIWTCPEAAIFWDVLLQMWRNGEDDGRTQEQLRADMIEDIFGFRLKCLPAWVVQWGIQQQDTEWEENNDMVQDIWASGCALTVTAIWRWNVNRVHAISTQQVTLAEAAEGLRKGLLEACRRYTLSLYPLTVDSKPKLAAAGHLLKAWSVGTERKVLTAPTGPTRIGLFDGGSRGNPGPGGSGSVVVELTRDAVSNGQVTGTLLWAAATALGGQTMTNNVAEFVGLQRLLAEAVEMKWSNLHVVGDSALIIGWMKNTHRPKSKKMKHWYRVTKRLAAICGVATWSHHYRQHNKTADWIANYAMDRQQSITVRASTEYRTHELYVGADSRQGNDIGFWWDQTGRRWCDEAQTINRGL